MRVAIIGAGIMGHALALVFALGGHRVRLTDRDPAALERAPKLMRATLDTLVEAGEAASWTPARLDEAVSTHGRLAETVADAELVVEAIVEKPEAKRAVFAELDALMPGNAILASNTSYLDIFPLVPERRLARTLIAHWYTPPYLIDLVDIVAGPRTDPSVVETVRDLVARMGQRPIVLKRFVAGYIANRIQSAVTLEVLRLLDEGVATPREIDDSIIHGLGLRLALLGHLAKADFTGLELSRQALANRSYDPPVPTGRSETLEALVAAGRTGVQAGRGYYDWGGRSPEDLFRERDRKLLALKRALREIGPLEGT